jgi:hypothetical protein
MDYPVPQPGWLLPGNVRKALLSLGGKLTCGFAEYSEVPQQRIPALAVGFELAGCDSSGEWLRLFSRVRSSR